MKSQEEELESRIKDLEARLSDRVEKATELSIQQSSSWFWPFMFLVIIIVMLSSFAFAKYRKLVKTHLP